MKFKTLTLTTNKHDCLYNVGMT